jgi:hypothetical protein
LKSQSFVCTSLQRYFAPNRAAHTSHHLGEWSNGAPIQGDPPKVVCEDCDRAMTFTTVKLELKKPSKLNVYYTCESCGREEARPWEAEPDTKSTE